jgi:membrane protease YdiL (CAAX protease family)
VSTSQDSAISPQSTYRQTNSGATINQPPAPAVPDPDDPPWSLLQAVLTWISSVALVWLVPQFCAIPYVAFHYRGLGGPTRETLLADKTFLLIFVAGFLPAHALTLVLAWAVVTRLGRVSPAKALGWSWKADFGLGKSVGLAFLLFIITMAIIYRFGGQETELERILRSSRAAALITAFVAAVTAPLVEEIIYRGLLYSALQRTIGPLLAVFVVASMFAGLHVLQYWPNAGAISAITLLSVALTVVRARTGRLLPCFVIHLVFNGIQSLIIVFDPYLRALYDLWRHDAAVGALNCLVRFLG